MLRTHRLDEYRKQHCWFLLLVFAIAGARLVVVGDVIGKNLFLCFVLMGGAGLSAFHRIDTRSSARFSSYN